MVCNGGFTDIKEMIPLLCGAVGVSGAKIRQFDVHPICFPDFLPSAQILSET